MKAAMICTSSICGDFAIAQVGGKLYIAEHRPVDRAVFSAIYGWVVTSDDVTKADLSAGILYEESPLTRFKQAWMIGRPALLGRLSKRFCLHPQEWRTL